MTTFIFTDGLDLIDGSAAPGNNTWRMLAGDDSLLSGIGNDLIYGGAGDDFLDANRGRDEIHGGSDHDLIVGGGGQRDQLYGDRGDDILEDAGDGLSDLMVGGAGDDVFITDGGRVATGCGSDLIFINPGPAIHLIDFQAEDQLSVSNTTPQGFAQLLDRLDRNDDQWLGLKDAGPPEDGFSVRVAHGNLELGIAGHHVILHEMTRASFDFLS